MGCNACYRGIGSPSPGQVSVVSSIVNVPPTPSSITNLPMLPDPPWYTTPLGIFGIVVAIAGTIYFVKRRPA